MVSYRHVISGTSLTCSRSRDKVHSVLALADDTAGSGLHPNYTLSVKNVYISTARHIWSQQKGQWLLYSGFDWSKLDELPSGWPDWRYQWEQPASFPSHYTWSFYHASAHLTAVCIFKDYPDTIARCSS